MYNVNSYRNQRRIVTSIGGNNISVGKSSFYKYRRLSITTSVPGEPDVPCAPDVRNVTTINAVDYQSGSEQSIDQDPINSGFSNPDEFDACVGAPCSPSDANELNACGSQSNLLANNYSSKNIFTNQLEETVELDPRNLDGISEETEGESATSDDLNLALRTWQLDQGLGNLGLTLLLKILRNPLYKNLFEKLPQTSGTLVRKVNMQYTESPNLIVECCDCKTLINIRGEILTSLLGNGWFNLSRQEIYMKMKRKNFIYNYNLMNNSQLSCSSCGALVTLNLIKSSKVFWFYSSILAYVKRIFNDPCSLANMLKPYEDCFPKELNTLLDIVRDKQWRSYDQMQKEDKKVAQEIREHLLKFENDPTACKELWEQSKIVNIGDRLRNIPPRWLLSQSWHGLNFWKNDKESRKNTLWNFVISLCFDWYAPFKHSFKSLGPLVIKIGNLPRETIASRIDLYLFKLAYLPFDRETKATKLQRFLKVFVDDFLEVREGKYVYNSLLNADCRFYISFGTVDADSVAAFQILCQQHPGGAKHNCRNCLGKAINCTDCQNGRPNHRDWANAFSDIYNLKPKSYYVEHGTVIDTYRHNLKMKKRYPNDREFKIYTPAGLERLQKEYGLLGSCVLNEIPEFNPGEDVINEGLHLLFLNTIPAPIKLWLSCKVESRSLYINESIVNNFKSILEDRLKYITFPRCVTRKGLLFVDKPSSLIGEDWKNFMLLVAIPLFRDILKNNIYYHYKLLNNIITIVLQDYMEHSSVENLQNLLKRFHDEQVKSYSTCNYKLTTHSLQHLPMDIRNWSIVKCHWTCALETIPRAERKLNVFTNGRCINHSFSKICAEKIAQHNLYTSNNSGICTTSMYRNILQCRMWPYFQASDGRNIYLGKKSKSISLVTLRETLLHNYNNNLYILHNFIDTFYTTIKLYTEEEVSSLVDPKIQYWENFIMDYYNLLESRSTTVDNIWDSWVELLSRYNICITNIIIYKSIYLGYRKFYGVYNVKESNLYLDYHIYSQQGDWVNTLIDSNSDNYGRLHRFIYIDINFNDVIKRDFLLAQFYNWVTSTIADTKTDLLISKPVELCRNNHSYFLPICSVQFKVCLQPYWEGSSNTIPHKTKRLIVPYHIWY